MIGLAAVFTGRSTGLSIRPRLSSQFQQRKANKNTPPFQANSSAIIAYYALSPHEPIADTLG
jgi:hypothetical protein